MEPYVKKIIRDRVIKKRKQSRHSATQKLIIQGICPGCFSHVGMNNISKVDGSYCCPNCI